MIHEAPELHRLAGPPAAGILDRRRRRAARDHRQGNKIRQHHAVQRPGLRAQRHRQGLCRLFRHDQRKRRRQRPQAQHDLARRRFFAAEDGGSDTPAGRERRRRLHVRHHGHRAEFGHREISQRRQSAASVPDLLGLEMERAGDAAMADGAALGAQLHGGIRHRGPLRAFEKSQRALRGALPERRRRQGISARRQGSARRGRRQGARDGDELRGRRSHGGFADRHAGEHQGRRVPDLQRDATRVRPGHPQGAGNRLAADALHILAAAPTRTP